MKDYSDWRRVLRNMLKGISYLSISPRPYKHRYNSLSRNDLTPEQKDAVELSSDFHEIGRDLEKAIEQFKIEHFQN